MESALRTAVDGGPGVSPRIGDLPDAPSRAFVLAEAGVGADVPAPFPEVPQAPIPLRPEVNAAPVTPLDPLAERGIAVPNEPARKLAQAVEVAAHLKPAITPNVKSLEPKTRKPATHVKAAKTPGYVAVPNTRKPLPDAAAFLARLDNPAAVPPTVEATAILVAQAAGPSGGAAPAFDKLYYLAGPDTTPAAGALIAANGLLLAGNYKEALSGVLAAMDAFTHTAPVIDAQTEFNQVFDAMMARAEAGDSGPLESFEASLPATNPAILQRYASVESRYALLEFFQYRMKQRLDAGDRAGAEAYAAKTMDLADRTMKQDASHPLQSDIVHYYYDTSVFAGGAIHEECESYLLGVVEGREPSIIRWTARLLLADLYARDRNNPPERTLQYADMIDELEASGVLEALADPGAYTWLKAAIEGSIGQAYYALGDFDQAEVYFNNTFKYPTGREPKAMSLYFLADMAARRNPGDPAEAIVAYQEMIERYPDDAHANMALLNMAALYGANGDFAQAVQLYGDVLARYGGSRSAAAAQESIDYIQANQWGTAEVVSAAAVDGIDPGALAMRCGPQALQKLLELNGIASSVAELATLAGTDETGSTMLGLARAAEAKGLALAGVRASSIQDLSPPFIALLDGNHFVLVCGADGETLNVHDSGQPETVMPLAGFMARWGGEALAPTGEVSVAQLLTRDAMEVLRGGGGSSYLPGPVHHPTCKPTKCKTCHPRRKNPPPGCRGGAGGGGGGLPDGAQTATGGSTGQMPGGGSCDRGQSRQGGVGSVGSPQASSGFNSAGVNAEINTFETSLELDEGDLTLNTLSDWGLSFGRSYRSEKGFPRVETSGTGKWWENNVGAGWSHSLNLHLRTSTGTTPGTVLYWDPSGTYRTYALGSTSGGYDWYYADATGNADELGNVLKRNTTTKKFTLILGGGAKIEFSAATTSGDFIARVESLVDFSGNATTFTYDNASVAIGKLTKVQSPAGDAQHLAFTYSGNLITKVELKKNTAVLNSVSFAYNGSSELVTVTDHAGKTVQYAYGTNGSASGSRYITQITNKRGVAAYLAWTFGLNGASQYEAYKITVDNADGLTTVYDRNITTSVCTVSNWDGAAMLDKLVNTPVTGNTSLSRYIDYYLDATNYERWSHEYNSAGALTKVVAPGTVDYAVYTYNSGGNVLTEKLGTGPVTTYQYDTSGQKITKMIDAAGIETVYTYGTNGLLDKVTHPALNAAGFQYAYDTYGHLTSLTSPLGTVTAYTYNTLGRVTDVVQDSGGLALTTSYVYDDLGNMTQMTDPRGKISTYEYGDVSCTSCGGGGQLIKVTDALSHEMEWVYDADGLLETSIDAAGVETDYAYDDMDRVTVVTYPAGGTVTSTMAYDKQGRVASRTGFGGNTTSYVYDHMGRTVTVTDAVGDVDYAYNSLGLLVSVTDSLGHATANTYDTAYRLSKVTDAVGKETHYAYDAYGRKSSVGAGTSGTVDPTAYTYNSTTGQVTAVAYGSSTYTANYTYDGAARLVKLTDWIDGTDGLRYAYDNVGRLTTLTDYDDSTLTYTYDAAGNVLTMVDYHGNTTTYTYNDIGQLATLTAPGSKVWSYTYGTGGRLTQVDIPNGMHTAYGYDAQGRQTSIHHMNGTTVVQGFDYTFDVGGDITAITHEDGAHWEYEYDGRDRLTQAERYDATPALLHRFSYTYDDGDNMLTKAVYDTGVPATVTTTFTYNNANEQTNMDDGATSVDMTYDEWGRLAERDDGTHTATYAYRYGGKLYGFTSDFPGEGNVTYETGGDGKRRSGVAGTDETWYNYTAGFDVVSTEDDADGSTGALTMSNVVRSPRAQVSATLADLAGTVPSTGTARYYATDRLGSTRGVRDASKGAVGTYEFTAYGSEYAHSGAVLASLAGAFTGKPWDDDAQLFHFPFRQYSPATARWTTRDPLGMVDGPNVYSYVNENPVNGSDGLGLFPDCEAKRAQCHADCARKHPCKPDGSWPSRLDELEYAVCAAGCEVAYQACVTLRGLNNLLNWCTEHPGTCVLGAVVIIGGVAFVVSTGGSGGLILVAV